METRLLHPDTFFLQPNRERHKRRKAEMGIVESAGPPPPRAGSEGQACGPGSSAGHSCGRQREPAWNRQNIQSQRETAGSCLSLKEFKTQSVRECLSSNNSYTKKQESRRLGLSLPPYLLKTQQLSWLPDVTVQVSDGQLI